jgi:intracellular septation protein
MIGNSQANGATPLVFQTSRRLARGLEEEGVWPWGMRPQQPILPILNQCVLAHFREVAANQSEVMIAVSLADFANSLERRLVAYVATQCVAGVRGIDDYAAATQNFNRLSNVATLRRDRVQFQIDAHGVGYDTRMNQLLELSPLIIFLVAFETLGIYWATGALMAACVLLLVIHRVRTGKFKTMHVITAAVVVSLGSATLLLHDVRFIQWKPTVLLGLTAVAFLGSMVIGKQPLVRRMFEGVFPEPLEVAAHTWMVINCLWVIWFAALAALNIYVARHFAESTWVHFKVYAITPATMVFMIPQVLWLSGKLKADSNTPPAAVDQ